MSDAVTERMMGLVAFLMAANPCGMKRLNERRVVSTTAKSESDTSFVLVIALGDGLWYMYCFL